MLINGNILYKIRIKQHSMDFIIDYLAIVLLFWRHHLSAAVNLPIPPEPDSGPLIRPLCTLPNLLLRHQILAYREAGAKAV